MSQTDALIARWAILGPAAVDQSRIDAAVAALAVPAPAAPERPDGLVDPEVAAAYAAALSEFEAALAGRHTAYAGIFLDPAVIAKLDQVNALTVAGSRQMVPIAAVMGYLRANNLWLPIRAAQASSEGAAAAVDYNTDPRTVSIDFDLPIVQLMLDDLVAHDLLSTEQRAELDAMASSQLPWWQNAGFTSPIGTGDLEAVMVQTGEVLT